MENQGLRKNSAESLNLGNLERNSSTTGKSPQCNNKIKYNQSDFYNDNNIIPAS